MTKAISDMGVTEPKTLRPSRRAALLALLTLPLADVRILARTGRKGQAVPSPKAAILTVPLDQWGWVRFTHKGKEQMFDMAEVFAILEGEV